MKNDIKINQTINEVADSKLAASNKESKQNNNKTGESGDSGSFSFNDLPDLSEENYNLFQKLANWAKQLF